MSRFVTTVLLLAIVSPLAFANVMIIRVVINSVPTTDSAKGATPSGDAGAPPPATDPTGASAPIQEAPPPGDPERSIVVVVPVIGKLDDKRVFDDRKSRHPMLNPEWNYIRHRFVAPFGTTYLFTDNSAIFLHPVARFPREQEIRDRYADWEAKKKSLDVLYDVAMEAMNAGMTTEAEAYIEKLFTLSQAKGANASAKVQKFAKVYADLAPKLKAPAPLPSEADALKDQLTTLAPNAQVQKYMHYALIYWDVPNDEVTRRLKMLEQNLRNFYLWHALRGEALKVPGKPLTVILAPRARDVLNLYRALEARSIASDAFYSAENDVLVLSPTRIDPIGSAFERMVRPIYDQGKTATELVKGNGPPISETVSAENVARLTTLALVDRVFQDDAELAAISREGTRQILHAIRALPNHVPLPRWLEVGYSSVYERPRVPFFADKESETPRMLFPTVRGTGSANYLLLKQYRDFIENGELDTDPASRLRKVLNDEYFAAIATGVELDAKKNVVKPKDDPKVDPAKVRAALQEKMTDKANATAWALSYFLVCDKSAELKLFGQELEHLPHDLPLDPQATRLAFARAFKLLQEDGVTLDPAALQTLGKQWDEFLNTVKLDTYDVTIIKTKPPEPMADPKLPKVNN